MSNTAVSSAPSDKTGTRYGRRRQWLVGLGILVAVSGGYLGWRHFAHSPSAAMPQPAPPVPVITTTVQKQNFPIVLTGIGYVTALNSATVRSMVTEPILSIDFKDGQVVKKDQLLAQLDPSTYKAQLDQAEANAIRPISKMDKSISADTCRWQSRASQRNSRSPPKRRRSPRKRPRSQPTRQRSSMPKPS